MATAKKVVAKTTTPLTTSKYDALENMQRADAKNLKFYLFHAPAAEIAQWALVDRMSPSKPKAIQRVLNKTKVRRIEEYLTAPFANTIATSVIVVFNKDSVKFKPGEDGSSGKLLVNWTVKNPAAVIVDGQHRVIGAMRVAHGGIRLNVVGIVGADATEGAFQFLVINNNSSKVNPSHVKALFTDYKEDQLLERMLKSGSTNIDEEKITALDYFDRGPDSPFNGSIKWEKNVKGFIVPNALEAGLAEIQNRSALLSLQEVEVDAFVIVWTTIKEKWGHLWTKESHLLEKAAVQSLTAYICDTLEKMVLFDETDLQLSDPDALKIEVLKILKRLEPSFFEVQWNRTGLDTRAGQELLGTDLRQMASNLRQRKPWHNDLVVVSIAAVSGEKTKKGARPLKKKS